MKDKIVQEWFERGKRDLESARKITAFYYENRYPPGPPSEVSEEEAEEIMNSAERIIDKIKAETGL